MLDLRENNAPRRSAHRNDDVRYDGRFDPRFDLPQDGHRAPRPRQSQPKESMRDHQGNVHYTPDLSADLLIEMPRTAPRRFKVYAPTVMIGRAQTADIVLNFPAISRQHARLFQVNNEYWLMDMGSTNGTMVNGRYIESIRLHDGDVMTIGADGEEPIYITIHIRQAEWNSGRPQDNGRRPY